MMLLAIYLCVSNVAIHFQETKDLHLEDGSYESNWQIWKLTLSLYAGSIVVALYAILFGVFVFALTVFHTYIITENLTTYEKLKK